VSGSKGRSRVWTENCATQRILNRIDNVARQGKRRGEQDDLAHGCTGQVLCS